MKYFLAAAFDISVKLQSVVHELVIVIQFLICYVHGRISIYTDISNAREMFNSI